MSAVVMFAVAGAPFLKNKLNKVLFGNKPVCGYLMADNKRTRSLLSRL